jgi:hypothetical protein
MRRESVAVAAVTGTGRVMAAGAAWGEVTAVYAAAFVCG